jgi:2,4-dienoyl-CoA reductase-like NADH-dependent reductase (Old Yellow Enzyme family)
MCQYSAHEGQATDWHLMHWGNLLNSGAAMFFIEATAVSPKGRITPTCLGLWDDATASTAKKLSRARHLAPKMPICIQLAHAGRKGSAQRLGMVVNYSMHRMVAGNQKHHLLFHI